MRTGIKSLQSTTAGPELPREDAIRLQNAKALIYPTLGAKIGERMAITFAFYEKIASANLNEL